MYESRHIRIPALLPPDKSGGILVEAWVRIVIAQLVGSFSYLLSYLSGQPEFESLRAYCLDQLQQLLRLLEATIDAQEGGATACSTEPGLNANIPNIASHTPHTRPRELTARQIEILDHLQAGQRPKEIARILHVELSTVRSHIRDAIAALEVRGVAAAVAEARKRGLLKDES